MKAHEEINEINEQKNESVMKRVFISSLQFIKVGDR